MDAKKPQAKKLAAILLAPSLVFIAIIMLYPLIYSLYLATYNYQLTRPQATRFDPVRNFTKLIEDTVFFSSLWHTVRFTFFTVAIGSFFGMVFALILDQLSVSFAKLRGIILIPWVIPGIVIGYLFMYIFDVNVGIVNYILQTLGVIKEYLPWLMRGDLAMPAVIIAHVWNQTPFYMLMFTAGLKAIPKDAEEAAYAEGASRWQEFRFVTFPFLKGIFVITSLLQIIRNFNNFPIIFTMTGGGPVYSTTTSVLYIFKVAFERFDMGYASLIGVLWVVVLLLLSIVYIHTLNKDF
jgi:multiple sugar transport system permease protein